MALLVRKKPFIFTSVLLGGILLRIIIATGNIGYDFQSYQLVVDILEQGKNVYLETPRYNYGPVWLLILDGLSSLATLISNSPYVFKSIIVAFLTLVDLLISYLLYKHYSLKSAAIYFLLPLTIIVTAHQNQFDNFAILVGFASVLLYTNAQHNDRKRFYYGLIGIGISLTIKHILFLFPVYLAIKEKSVTKQIQILAIPYLVFLLSFIPYFGNEGYKGIIAHVFGYRSVGNAPLLNYLFPQFFENYQFYFAFFIFSLLIFGMILKRIDTRTTFFLYLIALVVFSPSVISNHLSIAALPLVVMPNLLGNIFLGFSSYLLLLDGMGLNIQSLVKISPKGLLSEEVGNRIYYLPIFLLFLAFISLLWKIALKFSDKSV